MQRNIDEILKSEESTNFDNLTKKLRIIYSE